MKNTTFLIASLILFSNFSFAQQNNQGKSGTPEKANTTKATIKPAPKTATPNFKPGTGVPKPNEQKGPAPAPAAN